MSARVLGGLLALAVSIVATGACHSKKAARPDAAPDAAPPLGEKEVRAVDLNVVVGAQSLPLRNEVVLPADSAPAPAVVFVPGGGNVSHRGTRASNGHDAYKSAVHITEQVAAVFSDAGLITLAYDKRTCGPNDAPGCARLDTLDIDAAGPLALTADVDAAVAALEQLGDRYDGRYILVAHGQSVQVALSSSAAQNAAALVLVSPIPRRIDNVMPAALYERARDLRRRAEKLGSTSEKGAPVMTLAEETKNRAGSLEATFKAVQAGQFPDDARLMGATVTFWKGWIALTDQVPGKAAPAVPWIVVRGEHDTQFARRDRDNIDALGHRTGASLIVMPGKDHHLMPLDPDELLRIVGAVQGVLENTPLPPSDEASGDVG